jgi:hypothetical protein
LDDLEKWMKLEVEDIEVLALKKKNKNITII